MDPLYANLDKRNNSADQPQTPPAPQPTAYSMPNFGQPGSSSTTSTTPIVSNPGVPTPNATVPTTPIVSTPTRPTTSGSGDIILNIDQPKKKSKIYFGITILFIIIVPLVVFIILYLVNLDKSKLAEAKIEEVIGLIRDGEENSDFRVDENKFEDDERGFIDSLMAFQIYTYGGYKDISAFNEALKQKTSELGAIKTNNGKLNDLIKNTTSISNILNNTFNFNKIKSEIIAEYDEAGENKARDIINNQTYKGENGMFLVFSKRYTAFYENSLEEHDLVSEINCIKNGSYDYECIRRNNKYSDIAMIEYEIDKSERGLTNEEELHLLETSIKNEIKKIEVELNK